MQITAAKTSLQTLFHIYIFFAVRHWNRYCDMQTNGTVPIHYCEQTTKNRRSILHGNVRVQRTKCAHKCWLNNEFWCELALATHRIRHCLDRLASALILVFVVWLSAIESWSNWRLTQTSVCDCGVSASSQSTSRIYSRVFRASISTTTTNTIRNA